MKYANIDELKTDVMRTCAFLEHFYEELDEYGMQEYKKFIKVHEFLQSL